MVRIPSDVEAARPTSPTRNRNFMVYLAGVASADIGDQAWLTALAFSAAQSGSPLTATLVVAAGTIPRALLALVGGAVADRLPTRPLLIGANAARVLVLLMGLAALVLIPEQRLVVVVVVAVFFGAADALHIPAIGTMPRQLVEPGQLLQAASLRQLVQRLASLGGPALAGVVLAGLELDGTVLALIVVFGIAAVLLSLVRLPHPRTENADQPVIASIRELLGYLHRNRAAGGLVLALVGLNFFVIPVVSVGVALRNTAEGWGPVTLGLLLGCVGFGAAIGTVITLRIRPTFPLRFALGMLMLQGVALMSVGLAPLFGVAAAMAVVGLTSGLASPLLSGTLQATVDQTYLGRTFALISLSDNGLLPIALVGFGFLTEAVGLDWSTPIFGLGMVLLMTSAFVRPTLRKLQVNEEEGALA